MDTLYNDFSDATMTGGLGRWERPFLSTSDAHNYLESLDWMQPKTKEVFSHFISGLHTEHLNHAQRLQELGLDRHVYPLAGFCYATAINRSLGGEIMLSVRPQQFAETGSTGLQYIDPVGAHVMMNRGSGMYNEREIATKQSFERDCAAYITDKRSRMVNR
jgi:hypothetical protein